MTLILIPGGNHHSLKIGFFIKINLNVLFQARNYPGEGKRSALPLFENRENYLDFGEKVP